MCQAKLIFPVWLFLGRVWHFFLLWNEESWCHLRSYHICCKDRIDFIFTFQYKEDYYQFLRICLLAVHHEPSGFWGMQVAGGFAAFSGRFRARPLACTWRCTCGWRRCTPCWSRLFLLPCIVLFCFASISFQNLPFVAVFGWTFHVVCPVLVVHSAVPILSCCHFLHFASKLFFVPVVVVILRPFVFPTCIWEHVWACSGRVCECASIRPSCDWAGAITGLSVLVCVRVWMAWSPA